MCIEIKDIAEIHTGVYLKSEPDADVLYLQVSDFDSEGHFKRLSVPYLKACNVKVSHLLKNGDLLLAAKGETNFCTVYDADTMGKAVASSSFLVIQIKNTGNVLPEYLRWFLNRDDILKHFQTKAKVGRFLSITKAQLEETEIEIPSVEMQHKILNVDCLQRQSEKLVVQIAIKKRQLITFQLIRASKEI